MPKQRNSPMILRVLGIGTTLIQLFDIIIHAATNQIEPLRVSSNIIVLLWLAVVTSGRINAKFMQAAVGSIGAYLVLNGHPLKAGHPLLVPQGDTKRNHSERSEEALARQAQILRAARNDRKKE